MSVQDHEFAEAFWRPMGRYIFHFGTLERDVDWALSILLRIDYETHGNVVFSQIKSLPAKLRLMTSLTRKATKNKDQREAIDALIEEIRSQNAFRNALVHGAWGGYAQEFGPDGQEAGPGMWQKITVHPNTLKMTVTNVSIPDLVAFDRELLVIGTKLTLAIRDIVMDDAFVGTPPSHDKPPPPLPEAS